jgi:hypothetical protein
VIDDHPAKSASSDMSTRANIVSGVNFQKGQFRRFEKYDSGGWQLECEMGPAAYFSVCTLEGISM